MALNREKIVASAQKFIQRGQLDKAIKEFQRIVEEDPKDVRTLLKIGDLYSKKGERENAIQTYLKVAEFYSEQGFFLKAVAVFKQILKVDPSLIDVNVKLADLYGQLGLGSDALTQYQNVALFYEKAGDATKTLAILRKMVDLDPQNVGIRIKLAEMFAKAPETLKQAIDEFNEAAKVLKESNRLPDYAKVCERVLFLQPENMVLARELSELYLKQNDVKRALAKLQLLFKADPRDIPVLEMLAQAFLALGQTPKTVSVYRELAKIHADKGEFDKRRSYLKQILDLQPDDEEVRNELEMKLGAQKSSPAVATVASTSAATTTSPLPKPPPPPTTSAPALKPQELIQKLLTETDVYVKYGLKDKALEHLKKIFALAPNNLEAHSKVRDIYLQVGDVEGAVSILQKMAGIAQSEGDADRALEWLHEAARHDPNNTDVKKLLHKLEPEEAEILDEDSIQSADDELATGIDETGLDDTALGDAALDDNQDDDDEGVELVVDENAALEEEDLDPSFGAKESEGIQLAPPDASELPDLPQDDDQAEIPPPPKVEPKVVATKVPEPLHVQSGEARTDPKPRVQSGESLVPGPTPAFDDDLFDRSETSLGGEEEEETLTSPAVRASELRGKPAAELGNDVVDEDTLALVDDEMGAQIPAPSEEALSGESDLFDDEPASEERALFEDDGEEIEVKKAVAPSVAQPTVVPQFMEEEATDLTSLPPEQEELADAEKPDAPVAEAPEEEEPEEEAADEPAEEIDVSDELEEAEFFIQQELTDEAIEVYKNVLKKVPGHPVALKGLAGLGVEMPAAPSKPPKTPEKPAQKPVIEPVVSKPTMALKPAGPGGAEKVTSEKSDGTQKLAAVEKTPEKTAEKQTEKPSAAKPTVSVTKPTVTKPTVTKPTVTKPTVSVAAKTVEPPKAALPIGAAATTANIAATAAFKAAEPAKAAAKPEPKPETKPKEAPKVGGVTKSLIDESTLGDGDSFDLASELADDFADAADSSPTSEPAELQFSAEDVLSEFRKGVAATVSTEDFATHYDLGIAYKEMGLTEDAVHEFEISSRAKEKEVESWSMIGVCRVILNDGKGAIAAFKTALGSSRISGAQTVAIQYELANAYEVAGDMTSSKSLFEKVAKLDPKFRDAAQRSKGATHPPPQDEDGAFDLAGELAQDVAPPPTEPPPDENKKKGKISYV